MAHLACFCAAITDSSSVLYPQAGGPEGRGSYCGWETREGAGGGTGVNGDFRAGVCTEGFRGVCDDATRGVGAAGRSKGDAEGLSESDGGCGV